MIFQNMNMAVFLDFKNLAYDEDNSWYDLVIHVLHFPYMCLVITNCSNFRSTFKFFAITFGSSFLNVCVGYLRLAVEGKTQMPTKYLSKESLA